MAQTQVKVTKKSQAISIFAKLSVKTPTAQLRAKVRAELEAKLGVTPGCSSTYFANCKNGNWAVTSAPVAKATKPVVKAASKVAKIKAAKPAKKTTVKATKPAKTVAKAKKAA